MIIDTLCEFADAAALDTSGAATKLLGDVMDLGSAANPVGSIDGLYLVITVDTAVTSNGSATVQFVLASDAQAAIAVDGSASQHWASAVIPKATLVAGYQVCAFELPRDGSPTYERYLGILTVVGTAALTAGKVNAFLTNDPYYHHAYPNAVGA